MDRIYVKRNAELKDLILDIIGHGGFDADLNWIDTSQITNMSELFRESEFRGDISQWDTSNVTDMSNMFSGHILMEIYLSGIHLM